MDLNNAQIMDYLKESDAPHSTDLKLLSQIKGN
jgi:hypothetical protein